LELSDDKIAKIALLLSINPDTIERNYRNLRALGISDSKIATHATLLARSPETIKRSYRNLRALGISADKISSELQLIGRDSAAIERNYRRLRALGVSKSRITSNASLLGMNPDTIERRYQTYVGLLRQDDIDRNSGKNLLINRVRDLLGLSPETIEANIQFLYEKNIDYSNVFFNYLSTTVQTKRRKMAWMLRELFDYGNTHKEQKRKTIDGLYDFIRENPRILAASLNYLETNKNRLVEKATTYRT
jgi:DNA-binding transcriptional regulator YhcF (GntR family)